MSSVPQQPASAPAPTPRPAPKAPEGLRILFPSFLETTASMLRLVVIASFVLAFILQPFLIPSESMEQTLLTGDFVLVDRVNFAPGGIWRHMLPYREVQRGDIVVFHFPPEPRQHLVKRVIGLPGDHIRMVGQKVFINGQPLNEPYATYIGMPSGVAVDTFPAERYTDPGVDTGWWLQMRSLVHNGELVVPPGHYFVLGDNRYHSRDSRYWGLVARPQIVARPLLIYFSVRQRTLQQSTLPEDRDDRLGHDKDADSSALGFARWNRMFHLVR